MNVNSVFRRRWVCWLVVCVLVAAGSHLAKGGASEKVGVFPPDGGSIGPGPGPDCGQPGGCCSGCPPYFDGPDDGGGDGGDGGDDGGGGDINIPIHIEITRTCECHFTCDPPACRCCDTCEAQSCRAPDPYIEVTVFDCEDNVLDQETISFPNVACGETEEIDVTPSFPPRCPKLPRRFEVRLFNGVAAASDPCEPKYVEGPGFGGFIPAPPLCDMEGYVSACLGKGKLLKSTGRVLLSSGPKGWELPGRKVLYSLPSDTGAGANAPTYGETVNGLYRIPDGRTGIAAFRAVNMRGAGDVFVSFSSDELGFQTSPIGDDSGRGGSPRTSRARCYENGITNEKLEFSVRTTRGASPDAELRFGYFNWKDGSQCELVHEYERIPLDIRPLPCLNRPTDTDSPEYRRTVGGYFPALQEIRIPCCSSCGADANVCTEGNLTDWFATWPVSTTGEIRDGHGKGYKIQGDAVFAPGSEDRQTLFEITP